jgi:hypothetical protein
MSSQSEMEQKFINSNYNSTPFFTLNGKKMYCRVVNVYDGDTITVVLNIFDGFYKFSVRMNGIDTCEIKSKNEKNKELACFARSRLISLITDKDISETSLLKDRRMINNFLNKNVYCAWIECLDFEFYTKYNENFFLIQKGKSIFTQIRNHLSKIESLNKSKHDIEFQILNVRSISSFVPGGKEELARFIGPQDSNVKYREFKNRLF